MTDEEKKLLADIENAKVLYKLASGNLISARDRLYKFKKRKLEEKAEAAEWIPGIKVKGVPKTKDRVPKKLRDKFKDREQRGENTPKMGVYLGCKMGVDGEPVPDVKILYDFITPRKFTEMYDWHRVIEPRKAN